MSRLADLQKQLAEAKATRDAQAGNLARMIGGPGSEAKPASNLADLQIFEGTDSPDVMTEAQPAMGASGIYKGAAEGNVRWINMAKELAESGDVKGAKDILKQLQQDTSIKPAAAQKDPNSYQEYLLTTDTPTGKGYDKFLTSRSKALGGITEGSMNLTDITKIGIENAEGDVRPATDPNLTRDMVGNNIGLAEGEKYTILPSTSEMERKRSMEQVKLAHGVIDEMLLSGTDPIFDDGYTHDLESQLETGYAHITQSDPRLANYTSFVEGVAGQFARIVAGEKGALREEDIQRVVSGFFPKVAHIGPDGKPIKGDSKVVAEEKMRILRIMLRLPPKELANVVEEDIITTGGPPAGAGYFEWADEPGGEKQWFTADGEPL